MEPRKLATMMDELEDLKGAQAAELQENIHRMELQKNAILMGRKARQNQPANRRSDHAARHQLS